MIIPIPITDYNKHNTMIATLKITNVSFFPQVPEGRSFNATIPLISDNGKWKPDECHMYANLSLGNNTVRCQEGWFYNRDKVEESVVSQVRQEKHLCHSRLNKE